MGQHCPIKIFARQSCFGYNPGQQEFQLHHGARDMEQKNRNVLDLALALAIFFAVGFGGENAAMASQIAFVPSGGIGSANENPGPVNLGMVFTPTQNIQVDSLGFYYDTGLGSSEVVGLYNVTSQSLLASITVSSANPTIGSYLYSAITPVPLVAGQQYVVDEFVSGSLWEYGNTPTTDPGITYDGHDYIYSSQLEFPNSTVDAAGSAYYGPNFTYSSASVPEPGTCALTIFGFSSLFGLARRKLKR
jgi:hypothetical protein